MSTHQQNFAKQNGDPATGVSICIPRVFLNINWRRIKATFIDLRWGFVERVDVIHCGKFKRAYVHFAPGKWNTRDAEAMKVLAALREGTEVKIVYDEPWFWKIGLSRAKKPAEAPKPKPRPTVRVGAAAAPAPPKSAETDPAPFAAEARAAQAIAAACSAPAPPAIKIKRSPNAAVKLPSTSD